MTPAPKFLVSLDVLVPRMIKLRQKTGITEDHLVPYP